MIAEFIEMQILRRNIIAPYVNSETIALEVGAFTRPTFQENDIKKLYIADYYSTKELKEQVAGKDGDEANVASVDFVLKDTSLSEQLGDHKFNIIIAHHVLEHLIDPFRWMKDMEDHLNEDGLLFVTLPDKKYNFDRFRTDTTLAHFIQDFKVGGEHSLDEHCIDATLLYDKEYVGQSNKRINRLTDDFIKECTGKYDPGKHVHVFQMETFEEGILKPFLSLGYINYNILEYVENKAYGEFSFILQKTNALQRADSSHLFKTAADTYSNQETGQAVALKYKSDLVFDLGMYDTEDTKFYLKRGFRVVAVEANPDLCTAAQQVLADHYLDISILNCVFHKDNRKQVDFYINPDNPEASSATDWRVSNLCSNPSKVTVQTINLNALFLEHGVPHYIKCDLAGDDDILCQQLVKSEVIPDFVSIQCLSLDWLAALRMAGYDRFQLVNQSKFLRAIQTVDLMSCYGELRHTFAGNSSGPFGFDLPSERWLAYEEILSRLLQFFELKAKDPEMTLDSWFDVHATTLHTLNRSTPT